MERVVTCLRPPGVGGGPVVPKAGGGGWTWGGGYLSRPIPKNYLEYL